VVVITSILPETWLRHFSGRREEEGKEREEKWKFPNTIFYF
jgi:hypothetical protein